MAAARWVVAVRAALPSPRPQGWQALQQAVGLAESGSGEVVLVGDAARADGGPADLEEWLGRPQPSNLRLVQSRSPHRPPLAGLLFRRGLGAVASPDRVLLCRDQRVAAAQSRRRWAAVVMEWHVRPDVTRRQDRLALARADLHVAPSPGLAADLRSAGLSEDRLALLPNACGLDPERARQRAAGRRPDGAPVVAMGLHRRGGLDLALDAWAENPQLPPLWLVGRDEGGVRYDGWMRRIAADDRLRGRVSLLGPRWGAAREKLVDDAALWLALYPDDEDSRSCLCPLQVVDAAGSGLPVVATAIESVSAALGDFPHHPVVAGDPGSVALAVAAALAGPGPEPTSAASRPRWVDRAGQLRRLVHQRLGVET
jgi:glycosyltransferase involved in cell wall biosynthesis